MNAPRTLLCSLVSAFLSLASAQEVASPPRVVVEDSAIAEPLSPGGLELARRELASVPGGADVVDLGADVRSGRVSTLKDALEFSPGVYIQPRFGAEEARLSIRGSGLQRTFHGRGVALLLDGVPVNLADGGFDFQVIEPLAARYVEVWRGPNALQFGGVTLGGAINYVSPTGRDTAPVLARIEVGSFGYLRGQMAGGYARGPFDAYVSLTHFSQEGFREHARQDNQRLFLNLGWRWSPQWETRLYLTVAKSFSELPGALTRAQFESTPAQAAPGNLLLDQERNYQLVRTALKNTFVANGRSFELALFHSYKDLDHPIFQVVDQLSNDYGLTFRYRDLNQLWGRRNQFTAGVTAQYGRTANAQFVNLGAGGRRGARTADNDQVSRQLVVFAEEQHYLRPDLSLVTGGQFALATRRLADRFLSDGDQSDARGFSRWSPKLGLLWEVTPRIQFYANWSASFEPPSFGELGTPPAVLRQPAGLLKLSAQHGQGFELGTRGEGGPVRWDVTYYRHQLRGELLAQDAGSLLPLNPDGTTPSTGTFVTSNANRTLHQGLEAALDVELSRLLGVGGTAPALRLRQVYRWSDFRFVRDRLYGNNALPGAPAHFYRAELLAEWPGGLYAGPNVEFSSSQAVNFRRTLFADGYALLGVKLGWRSRRWNMFLEGRNLANARYVATVNPTNANVVSPTATAALYPGEGRAIFGGVEFRW